MWLEELQLTDFRGFRHLKLDLRRQLTVVIGVNGAGKSSLVRAIEIGASQAVKAAFDDFHTFRPIDNDVRIGGTGCSIDLAFEDLTVRVTRTSRGNIQCDPSILPEGTWPPLCIVFKSNRAVLHADERVTTDPRDMHPPWDLDEGYSCFDLCEQWFRYREDLENQERVRSKRLDHVDRELGVARDAIARVLPRYSDPHIERSLPLGRTSQLVLTKDGQQMTADMLSEGERSLLVFAMTIARQLSLLESANAVTNHAAVVVIDEIELHLHPKWQRVVIPSLLEAFPSCQFIVTTHSPQVIGSVPRESIVMLDDFAVYDAPAPTEGRDSNAILEEIMDVRERDEASQAELDAIAGLIDRDDLEHARTAIDRLAARWGEDDREVVRLRTALQFRTQRTLPASKLLGLAAKLEEPDASGTLRPFCQAGVFWLTRQARKRPSARS